ncbi:MAG: transglycosylase SLT domain-containing protein [Terriglobales bacterium]
MSNRVLVIAVLVSLSVCAASPVVAADTAAPKHKTASSKKSSNKKTRSKKTSSVRARRVHRAFVASEDLKPMARQLLDARSPAAYAGVERYARKHAHDDAGALANLALGYAHILDHDPAKSIAPLKLAQARAGELADYVTYFLGSAEQAAGKSDDAVTLLRDFQAKYPDSLFKRESAIVYANAVVATGEPAAAVVVLSKNRLPTRSDVELYLAQAQLKAGDTANAADTLRHLYFSIPASAEADRAAALLRATPDGIGATYALQKVRADALLKSHRYRDAADAYRDLLALAAADDRDEVQVSLGAALHRAGDDRAARQVLEQVKSFGETEAERLFYLLEIARSDNDDSRFQHTLEQLRVAAPHSSYLEDGLLTAGNVFLLRNDYDHAIDMYRELRQRFPQGHLAAYANWKDAWLSLRQNRIDDARQGFERQIADYATSQQVPAALFWRARIAEDNEKNLAKARAYYATLTQRFPNYYYADLARDRLSGRKGSAEALADPLLEKLPSPHTDRRLTAAEPPEDDLHLQKSRLLHNAGMTEYAIRELKAAAAEGGSDWATSEMARLYRDDGQYHRVVELMKAAVPSYFSLNLDALPRPYWEDLFPRPFWSDLQRDARNNGLDPFLVASLIRQESEFNPGAVSRANAVGLMQVLPSTGKKLARAENIRHFNGDSLLVPEINLKLGTRYFRELVDHFNGNLEYALAAYNAGSDRVDAWIAAGNFRDTAEFVESIPFTETREYVQAIMRNATVYRKLYAGTAKEQSALE